MAGKSKSALDYFSVDVNMNQDIKMRRVLRGHGPTGLGVFITLLQWVYGEGQHLKFDNIDNLSFSLSDHLNMEEDNVLEIILFFIKLNLFDKECFDKGYLTSKSVQTRYYQATKRRTERFQDECWLLSQEEMDYLDSKQASKNSNHVNNDDIYVNKDGIDVYKDGIDVYKDVIPANKNKQSKSNSKSKRDKRKINSDMGSVDPITIPFKTNYYLQVLINNKIVKGTEDYTEVLNDYLYVVTKNHNKDDVRKAIYYTIKRIEYKNWKDAEGFEVYNKQAYLEEAISNNIKRNESVAEINYRKSHFQDIFHNKV